MAKSERDEVYRECIQTLKAAGAVYAAWETAEELDAMRRRLARTERVAARREGARRPPDREAVLRYRARVSRNVDDMREEIAALLTALARSNAA